MTVNQVLMPYITTTTSTTTSTSADHWSAASSNHIAKSTTQYPVPQCLVFLHIPKVGGRSVGTFLRQVAEAAGLEKQSIYHEKNPYDISADKTFTIGHFTTALFDLNPKLKQCYTMTVLREPVDRAMSAFFFHKHNHERDIDKCLSDNTEKKVRMRCRLWWQYSNDITRRLAGLDDTSWNTWLNKRSYSSIPNQTHLEKAKENLVNNFDAVCYLQDLPLCADKILKAFHLDDSTLHDIDTSMLKLNKNNAYKTKKRPEKIDAKRLKQFTKLNALDQDLYAWSLSMSFNETKGV